MQTNVLEYLEGSLGVYRDKTAFTDGQNALSYGQLSALSRSAGSFLAAHWQKQPLVVFMRRTPWAIAAFLSVLYSGNIYIPIDEEMPRARIEMILESVQPQAIICDEASRGAAQSYGSPARLLLFGEISSAPENAPLLAAVRGKALDTDPLYIVFTSGSTGRPKGVMASHRNVIDYVDALTAILGVNSGTVFGMQVPLYVDACLKEIYPALKQGATTVLIPKGHFLFPLRLVEFMNRQGVNTVCWVVSALTMISGFGTLEKLVPKHLHTVAFGSEVFPVRQFNLWRKALPGARFINLYGPTECTGMSCWYEATRSFAEGEAIPIGRPFPNTGVFLLNDEGNEVSAPETPGEVYIRGAGVTLGYFGDEERTAEAFVQNPLQRQWRETVYKTGDLAKYNAEGDLVYLSRRDDQIKHMGYRIELAEIEAVAGRLEGVQSAACVYHKGAGRLVLFYVRANPAAGPEKKEMLLFLRKMLSSYMVPAAIVPLEQMPLTANGKIDRVLLASQAEKM